jgi:hypothetical protein
MQKAKGSWTKIGTVTAMLCCCLGIAYETNPHSAGLPFPKLQALIAAKKIERIVITPGDPFVEVKIKGRTNEESTYVRTEDRMALIRQSTQADGVELWLH